MTKKIEENLEQKFKEVMDALETKNTVQARKTLTEVLEHYDTKNGEAIPERIQAACAYIVLLEIDNNKS